MNPIRSAIILFLLFGAISCSKESSIRLNICNSCYDDLGREYAVMISRIDNSELKAITKRNFCSLKSSLTEDNIHLVLGNCLGAGYCSVDINIDIKRSKCEVDICYEHGNCKSLTCIADETDFTLSESADGTKTIVGRVVTIDQKEDIELDFYSEVRGEIFFSFELNENKKLEYEPNGVFF